MAILKCKMCGGDIEISSDKTYGICDSCGSTMTFPKATDEQRANLFNRANHFRRQSEFDKAISAYERILDQDNTDAEAHWGIVLSRFGIEYVEDPISHERIPTCHRVQTASILTDMDYLAAKEYAADSYSASLYEQEAKRIAEIQRDILAISMREEPYDVFICYKESTDGGSRTHDSILAQDIYYQLIRDGKKVFFSRITLEDKLGQQYEPYIFAALNSAKVMLVVGTKPEYFNAVWVKNEWSRYLDLMKKDRSRLLIPCYRGIDPYDLPDELSALQSLDMGKIGFMQDLLHVIQKVLAAKEKPSPEMSADAKLDTLTPGVSSLLRRAQLFVEDGIFDSASEYVNRILDIDPECAAAYLLRLQIQFRICSETDLANLPNSIAANPNYQKAIRFASPEQRAVYEGYERVIAERKRLSEMKEHYDLLRKQFLRHKRLPDNEQEPEILLSYAIKFDSISEYEDSISLAEECRNLAEKIKTDRLEKTYILCQKEKVTAQTSRRLFSIAATLDTLGDYKDAHALAVECREAGDILHMKETEETYLKAVKKKRNAKKPDDFYSAAGLFAEIENYKDALSQAEECRQRAEAQDKKFNKKAQIICVSVIVIIIIVALLVPRRDDPQIRYSRAVSYLASQEFDAATEEFIAAGSWLNSELMVYECQYQKAKALFDAGNYDGAYAVFSTIRGYRDVEYLLTSIF